jgi:hypothetical protein
MAVASVRFVFSIPGPPNSRSIYRDVALPAVPRVGDTIDAGVLDESELPVVAVTWTLDGHITVGLGQIDSPQERAEFLALLAAHGWQGASPDPAPGVTEALM